MPQNAHFPLLDGLRGVAALAVVWFHLHFVVGYDCAGPLAVDLFFILSGFVVAAAYDRRLDHDLTIPGFLKKRFIRLYPMFAGGLLIALVVQQVLIACGAGALDEHDTLLSFAIEAFWLPSPFNGGTGWTFPLDGPAWSLSLEILANVLFAVFHRRLGNGALVAIVAVSGSTVVAAVLDLGTINEGWSWATLPIGLARVSFAFPLGILMYRKRDLIPLWLNHVPAWLSLALLAIVLFAPESTLIDIAFLLVGAPLLIAIGYRTKPGAGHLLLRRLGELSYPIYAIHGPLVLLVQGAVKRSGLHALGPIIALIALSGMVIVSLSLVGWEATARRRLAQMLGPRGLTGTVPEMAR